MWTWVTTLLGAAMGLITSVIGWVSRRNAKKAVDVVADNANARNKIDAENKRRSDADIRERMQSWTRRE